MTPVVLDHGEVVFRRYHEHPEMGTGTQIVSADPFILIDREYFGEIFDGEHEPLARIDVGEVTTLHLVDDYGSRYVYVIGPEKRDCFGRKCLEARWAD